MQYDILTHLHVSVVMAEEFRMCVRGRVNKSVSYVAACD